MKGELCMHLCSTDIACKSCAETSLQFSGVGKVSTVTCQIIRAEAYLLMTNRMVVIPAATAVVCAMGVLVTETSPKNSALPI